MSWQAELLRAQQERRDHQLWRERRTLESPQGAEICVAGQKLLNFSSNDYLGLAGGTLAEASRAAIDRWGTGSGAAHLICGHLEPHQELERRLAAFVGAERALLFSTGFMANLAVAQALVSDQDDLLQDRLNHASLIDAARYSGARLRRYPHGDVTRLQQIWERTRTRHPNARQLVLTDGVFSMDGDVAPLKQLSDLVHQMDGLLVVDEAHGLGVLGERGRGALETFGLRPTGSILMMGTLGKALGSFGAFVAGDEVWIEQLIQHARPYIYTTALPPQVAATSLAALDWIEHHPGERQLWRERKQRLLDRLATHDRQGAIRSRLMPSPTPIQPILIGDTEAALKASEVLRGLGVLGTAIRPPTVPVGQARIRLTFTSAHTDAMIDRLVSALTNAEFLDCLATSSDSNSLQDSVS